jgi:putative DNA primase/helicase
MSHHHGKCVPNQAQLSDFVASFARLFHEVGLAFVEPIPDGKLHRIGGTDEPRNLVGWYVLHCNGRPNGVVGNWRTGKTITWRSSEEFKPFSRFELEAISRANRHRDAAKERRLADAIRRATAVWSASVPADPAHPYLACKRVLALGARQWKDAIVVPLRDAGSRLVGLQFIGPNGCKKFMRGTVKRGAYYAIGGTPGERLLIAEGFATGASLHMASGLPVAIALDAGNLLPVARVLRSKFPSVAIIMTADNDESGVGFARASEAARSVNGSIFMPPTIGDDWNDVHVKRRGLDEVRSLLEKRLV